ncbi:MAG: hypothetical protein FD135_1080 [Comamonadaceae bacterium]|nr:MAG: hypothetical protein FD135_1080 [Comamonadaceae bacterium]
MQTHFIMGVCAALAWVAQASANPQLPYQVATTGQTACYDQIRETVCPQKGDAYFGQDAQFATQQPNYVLSPDGLSVQDKATGLTWQRSPDTNGDARIDQHDKLTWAQIQRRPAELNAMRYGGYSDWRLPTIKELYSLMDFSGRGPGPGELTASHKPFIDTRYFLFAYGDVSRGERLIDAQYASSTLYATKNRPDMGKLFGVNFADGRIKGYDLIMPGRAEKTFFLQCVRGNPAYGRNTFIDNGNATVTDRSSALMWAQSDSATGMDWPAALRWVQTKNRENYLGYNDWRLPNAKELQSLVDYTRSPEATGSAAIDALFRTTPITNEAGQADYPAYWSSTTHSNANMDNAAVYIAFGRAMGFMRGAWRDVHGAGSQRSDPKVGNPAQFPQGRGPQGDAIRILNFVRLVRTEV